MNDIGTKTILTDRLTLRRFTRNDALGMYEGWASDNNVTKYLNWKSHNSIEETKIVISKWIDSYSRNSYNWAIELKQSKELIGSIEAIQVNRKHHNCEIGYCIGSRYWNQGYATEALKSVIDYMLDDVKLHVVEAKYNSNNISSGRVMDKAGMKKEAVLSGRRYDPITNSYQDLIYYSIMR